MSVVSNTSVVVCHKTHVWNWMQQESSSAGGELKVEPVRKILVYFVVEAPNLPLMYRAIQSVPSEKHVSQEKIQDFVI